MLATIRTNALLPLIYLAFGIIIKQSYPKVTFITIEYILINARFLLHITVLHKFGYLFFQLHGIKFVIFVSVVYHPPR